MTTARDGLRVIHVSRELVDEFEGWLEFAGANVPGVPQCPDWPRQFTIARTEIADEDCYGESIKNCTSYVVRSPEWPADENRCWTPTLYGVYTSAAEAKALIKAKDYPEFAPETDTPEG